MILSSKELEYLTGKKRRSAQRRALQKMKIEHFVRPDGVPVVSEAALRHKSMLTKPTPNWDAI